MNLYTKTLLDIQRKREKEAEKNGTIKGKRVAIIDITKKMIQNKINTKKIEEITGLSKEEIEKLAKSKT